MIIERHFQNEFEVEIKTRKCGREIKLGTMQDKAKMKEMAKKNT